MKKLTPHHVLTPNGGRIAARRIVRPVKRLALRPVPGALPFYFQIGNNPNNVVIVTGRERVNKTREKGAGS